MPLTPKGLEILRAMKEQYGEEAGTRVFEASKTAGTITDVGDASPLEKLPKQITLAEMNRRNRLIWGQGCEARPPNGAAAVRPKVT